MEWQDLTAGFTTATVAEDESLDVAMHGFCEQIRAYVLPKNQGVDWNYIRVELWSDSGRMIAFPANRSKNERIEKAGCQIVFNALLAQYEDLADSDIDDDAFAEALVDAKRSWIQNFVVAAREAGLSGQKVQFWDGDGEDVILEVEV